ncbi:MAG: site-specific integrase [Planctomycetota bacterium]
MRRENLTPARIERLRPRDGRAGVLCDTQVVGLRAVAHPGGTRSWEVVKKLPSGRVVRRRLGQILRTDGDAIEEVRDDARRVIEALVKGREADAVDRRMTVAQMLRRYAETPGRNGPAKADDTRRGIEYVADRLLGRLGEALASGVTQTEVRALYQRLRGESDTPHRANRAIGNLRAAYSVAIESGWIERTDNPAKGIKLGREKPRERILNPDEGEVRRFLEALNAEPCATQRDAVLLALSTGLRKGDLLRIEWEWVDVDAGRIEIPALSKTGDRHVVKLSPSALGVIRDRASWRDREILRLRRDKRYDRAEIVERFVFPTTRPGKLRRSDGHLTDIRYAVRRASDRAGIRDLRPHDLRRTFGTLAMAANLSPELVGQALGHRRGSTATAAYQAAAESMKADVGRVVGDLIERYSKGAAS